MRSLLAILLMLITCAVLLVWAGKFYLKQERKHLVLRKQTEEALLQPHIDSAIALLRTGDVVLRMGTGTFSRLLADINRRDKSYSHCGITVVENGYPFIYHCLGTETESEPCIRRDSAARFFSTRTGTAAAIARYRLPDSLLFSLPIVIAQYRKADPIFDTRFSLSSDDSLYCSEFIYKILTTITADTAYIPISSIPQGRFIGTDDLFLNPHAHIVWRGSYK